MNKNKKYILVELIKESTCQYISK